MMVRVWDAPTRLFHWALVLCFGGLVLTSQVGGMAMAWHFRFGYGVLTLLLFRAIWGLQGGHWSKFSTFVVGPRAILRYLRKEGKAFGAVGHNPLGSLSVLAMLVLLAMQATSGLMSDDEIATSGPLVRFVSSAWVSNATYYHIEIGKLLLLGLVFLHLGAIAFHYLDKQENLVKPMITGDKDLDFEAPNSLDAWPERRLAALIFLACVAAVSGVVISLNG